MWSRRDAADIPPSSATATNAASSRISISPAYGGDPSIFPVYAFSALLGVFEVAAAVLIAIKPSAPRLSIIGSLLAILLFLATISFLFTTPGVGEPAGGGFPAISLTGEFLLKDIPLLGLSVLDTRGFDAEPSHSELPSTDIRGATSRPLCTARPFGRKVERETQSDDPEGVSRCRVHESLVRDTPRSRACPRPAGQLNAGPSSCLDHQPTRVQIGRL